MDSVHEISAGHSALMEEKVVIISAGIPFKYPIPYFDILAVELWQIKLERDLFPPECYDFIRNDSILTNCMYPSSFIVMEAFYIEVCDNFYRVSCDR